MHLAYDSAVMKTSPLIFSAITVMQQACFQHPFHSVTINMSLPEGSGDYQYFEIYIEIENRIVANPESTLPNNFGQTVLPKHIKGQWNRGYSPSLFKTKNKLEKYQSLARIHNGL